MFIKHLWTKRGRFFFPDNITLKLLDKKEYQKATLDIDVERYRRQYTKANSDNIQSKKSIPSKWELTTGQGQRRNDTLTFISATIRGWTETIKSTIEDNEYRVDLKFYNYSLF